MSTIPYGYCKCGCGEKTNIAPQNSSKRSWIKGEPIYYIKGHQHKNKRGCQSTKWKGGRLLQSGYIKIFFPDHPRANNNGYIFEHILKAEKVIEKPLELPHVVHHHTPEQLVICENQAYHLLLHQRQRALESCGHANWRKCWICKKYDSLDNITINGECAFHKNCRKKYRREFRKLKNWKTMIIIACIAFIMLILAG